MTVYEPDPQASSSYDALSISCACFPAQLSRLTMLSTSFYGSPLLFMILPSRILLTQDFVKAVEG